MNFIKLKKNKIILTALASLTLVTATAQTTNTASAQATDSGYNLLAILLILMIIVLAFVIWGMGQVLTALGRQLVDKEKNSSKVLTSIFIIGLSLFAQVSFAQTAPTTTEPVKAAANYGGLSQSAFEILLAVIGIEIIVILFLVFSIRRMYTELLPQKIKVAGQKSKLAAWWSRMDKRIFTKAVAVEKEADVLLDHDYDGIQELDNALPPWWKYGFYITIVVGFIYLLNFHVFGIGKNPTEEYNAEMENARIEKERYEANNKDRIDENNVPMADAAGIKEGERLYEANCIACHLKGGAGSVGPNLTDDYWLHKGSLNDIYNTIKVGYPDKGMQSWSSQFNPKQISYLTSYIKSLHGSNPPNAKAAQGELFTEAAAAPTAATDSAAVIKPDSAAIKK